MAESEDSMTKQADINSLLEHFSKNTYSAKGDVTGMLALNTCLELFGKDYTYTVINNNNGQLCNNYPSKLVVLDYEGSSAANTDNKFQSLNDKNKLDELIRHARVARCWTRFVAPVILYKGKHICRSATLAGWQELFGRKGMDMVMSGGGTGRVGGEEIQSTRSVTSGSQHVFDRHRGRDIALLEELNVRYICDLMVEMKKVKCGIYITSSEKVDKENRYKNFSVISLPYPGCEFFSFWKERKYDSENTHYDWSQELNTALLDFQNDPVLTSLPMDWENYKDWDIVKLTQNYLQAFLKLVDEGSSGVLIHCISGWDRTPLFISLLRLSLWADGVIHKSLPPSDILYLTLAYDWYLFGHSLPDRISKGQEIMYFCFKMLLYIGGQEFSVVPQNEAPKQRSQPGSPAQGSNVRFPSPPPSRAVDGLRHQGSNISLTSNTSFGSDGVPFVMDTTQDEETISPLDWDAAPSPQRSRHASGSSVEDHRVRRCSGGKGPRHVDSPPFRGSPPHHRRHGSSSSSSRGSGTGRSPEVHSSSDPGGSHRSCSVGVCDQPLSVSVVSNHFSCSSPVNVPSRPQPHLDPVHNSTSTPSFGSWVDVGMPQMTPPHIITPPKLPAGLDAQISLNSCHEASDLNAMTSRKRKLYAVAQMFEEAYLKAVLSRPVNGSGTLSSLFGNVAEKMGFRSGPR